MSSLESFVGLRVRLDLVDGALMEGVIRSVDEVRQLLILSEVTCRQADGTAGAFPGLLEVFGSDVSNIELLPPSSTTSNLQPPSPAKKKQGKKQAAGGWAETDTRAIKSGQDFDFQASLGNFDKQRVFAEIQAQDQTAAGQRLVAHNLRSNSPVSKVGHKEAVLGTYAEDADAGETLLVRPSSSKQNRLLLRTASGVKVDPCDFSSSSMLTSPSVRVECAAKSMATHISTSLSEMRAVEFVFINASDGRRNIFLEAVCFCAARHLAMAGISSRLPPLLNVPSGPYANALEEHAAFYKQFSKMSTLALPSETLLVDSTQSRSAILPPAGAHLVLDHIPSTPPRVPTTILVFDLGMLATPEAMGALAGLRPSSADLLLANDGQVLKDSRLKPLFTASGSYADTVNLYPFTQ